jgi:predicted Zn-dependent peptidase
MIWVRTGSRFEDKKLNGISHFLEHMVFKGSKKRPTAKDIAEAVDSLGAEYNAGTSKEYTNFYIKSRAGVLGEAFDILSDMVLNPVLREDDIEREKGVILEEMAMYEDTPLRRVGDIFENLIYSGDPLGWDIIGTREAVKSITKDDFLNYIKKYYYAEDMLVTIAGAITESQATELVKEHLGGIIKKGAKPKKPNSKITQDKSKVLVQYKKTDQTHIILGFRGYYYGHKGEYAEAVLASILGGGMSSRMFTEVREKRGLAYAVRTSEDHYMDNGYFATYAGLETKRMDEGIKVILDQYYGLATGKYPIEKSELNKAKEYIKGHIALALEDTKNVNAFFASDELFLGRSRTPKDYYDAIDRVTVDDLYAIAKYLFNPRKLNLAVIGPFRSNERFVNLIK